MGIDFLVCSECETGFPDVDDYKFCECGRDWCDGECAEKGGLENNYEDTSCKYCREEDYEDKVLLDFVIEREGISREDLIGLYKRENNHYEQL